MNFLIFLNNITDSKRLQMSLNSLLPTVPSEHHNLCSRDFRKTVNVSYLNY